MKKAISLIIISFYFLSAGYSQQTTDLKEVFLNAESYYLFEEFDEALPLYLRLHRAFPDNYNLNFKIGVCYLNNPYEKEKSISYLEKASDNINPKYKDSNFKELGAPLEALFYLGNSYRINNDLDKARAAYTKFKSKLNTEIYDVKLVDEQLAACDVAEKLMKKPVDMDVTILSNQLNTRFADQNPAVSGDETKMVFISKLQFYDAVFYSEKKNGEWTPPRNITPELGVDGDVYPTCLSYDGTLLFVYRNDDFVGNLYSSTLVNGSWTPLVKLNENINTKFWESHASISKDGNTLYFTSNRKGGFGGLDIYTSTKQSNGDWDPPVNLGSTVNSPYNEETPFITEDGRRLFFSSYGHYNMGGYDVFMSALNPDGSWANPVNLGYPVNSTDDDEFFCPVKNGEVAYFPVYKETGYGKFDIYRYKVYNADHPRKYEISGKLDFSGVNAKGKDITISIINKATGDTLAQVNPDDEGNFSFDVPAGEYSMVFDSKKFEKEIQSLDVSPNTPHSGMDLKEQIKLVPLPEKLTQEELNKLLQIEDTVLIVTSGKPIVIPYEAEKGSMVVIKQYLDSVLVKIDTVQVDKRKQTYKFSPQPGLNQIEFTLTDKDGNQVTKKVTVAYSENGDVSQILPQEQINNEVTETTTNATAAKEAPQENVDALINDLSSRADGKLKEALQNLDPQKEGITNTAELFKYLNENAGKLGYSAEDVNRLMVDMISKKDLAEFLVHLKNASEGNLKTAISGLDLAANSINTPLKAVEYLVNNSTSSGFLPEDVVKALAVVGSDRGTDQNLFINKLIHSANEGELKVYLKSLDLNALQPALPQDFALGLYNSTNKNFSKQDVLGALTNLAVSRDASEVLQKLIALADEGALKSFMQGLDLKEEGIYTAEELINHLYANADLKGFTKEEVDQLLQKYLYNQISEIDDLRLKMAALATGNLKDYLEKMDLNNYSFGSREEFIDFLKSEALKNGFTEADVNNILLKLSYSGDLDDIIKRLVSNSDGNLRKTLENLDPAKEGITTFDELIRYLLDNSEKFGYSKEDVYKLLGDYTANSDLELFLSKLIRLADPETKIYLEKLDLKANYINDRADLITFLLKQAAEGAVNQENMIRLLLKATDTKIADILPVLQNRSTGDLNKLLNSGKLPLKDLVTSADLYDFLIAASVKNKAILPSDINKLFSDYLVDHALNQFLGELINHSEGRLKDFLQKINLKESGITGVSGLIQYIIDNAAANGFSEDDVFALIGKVLGREKLVDFIAKLREFAPEGLVRLLDQLDLDKAGINSIEDLMKYLAEHAAEYGYTMEDVWNAILQLVISGEDHSRNEMIAQNKSPEIPLGRGVAYTAGIFAILGIMIFFLVLIKRREKNLKT
jgi:hypothetical protein